VNDWHAHFSAQAAWQRWAYSVLFAALDELDDMQRRADQGLAFGSVHHTLDHLLGVHHLWSARLAGEALKVDFSVIQVDAWEELKTRMQLALAASELAHREASADWYAESARFTSSNGQTYAMPRYALLSHVYTHHVHHRGQISAVVTRLGLAAPEMDFFYFLRDHSGGIYTAGPAPLD
jgi:uncharacterized damage-inducible protein DinB